MKIKQFILDNWKPVLGVVLLLLFFFIGGYFLYNHTTNLRKEEREYQSKIKLLNDSILILNNKYKLNSDTVYIAEKEANKQADVANNINQKTNDTRIKQKEELSSIDTLDIPEQLILHSKLAESFIKRFSEDSN